MGVGLVANHKAECPEMSNQTLKLVQNSKQEHTKKSVQQKATKPTYLQRQTSFVVKTADI